MMRFDISFLFFAIVVLAFTGCNIPASQKTISAVEVQQLPPLPDSIGFGGVIAGTHNGVLMVAGGTNFPEGMPWDGGVKKWYDKIYTLSSVDGAWTELAKRLPYKVAYSGVVSTSEGVIIIGGSDADGPIADVIRLKWQGENILIDTLPKLPQPSHLVSAALIGQTIYALPGLASNDPTDVITALWALNLDNLEQGWSILPGLPGDKRAKVVTAAKTAEGNQGYFYCFSGESITKNADETFNYDYSKETYRFNPKSEQWEKMADVPRGTAAGTAMGIGQSSILVLGGWAGEHWGIPFADWPEFPGEIWSYHTLTDTWQKVGDLEKGAVTTAAVNWSGGIVIPSGEIKPGVRTRDVQHIVYQRNNLSLGGLDMAVLIGYLLVLIWLGISLSKRNKTTDEFFLAGKRIPWWAAGLSIYATQLSAISFIALPAVSYAGNLVLFISSISIFLIVPIIVKYYLPFFYRLNLTTAYEYLEARFSLAVRLFGSLSFCLFQLVRMAIIIFLPALALVTATGMNIYLCIFLMAALATAYTILGGMEAVIWTDVIQVIVLFGGTLVAIVLILMNVDGFGHFVEIASEAKKLQLFDWRFSFFDLVTWAVLIGNFFISFGPYTTEQTVVQRYLTTKDIQASSRSIWLNGIVTLPSGLIFLLVGTALFVFYKLHPEWLYLDMQNDEIYPLFIATQMPAGLSGLLIAGIFAASMSSLDSSMHSLSTAITTDFYQRLKPGTTDKSRLKLAKGLVLLLGILAMLAAFALVRFDVKSLFFFFQKVIGLLSSGLAGIFFLGIFTTRSTSVGVLVGAIASTAIVAYLAFFTNVNVYWYAVVGMPVCIIIGYFISIMFPTKKSLAGLTLYTQE